MAGVGRKIKNTKANNIFALNIRTVLTTKTLEGRRNDKTPLDTVQNIIRKHQREAVRNKLIGFVILILK